MKKIETFDIVIIGGGPAGSVAALRLLQLGYRVALVEQHNFPRPQIGESLSPGVWNILNYLDATHLLQDDQYLHNLDALVVWETNKVRDISGNLRGPGVIVNRGTFDQRLLTLAVARGLQLFQPAKFESFEEKNESREITIRIGEQKELIRTQIFMDARGRNGTKFKDRISTAHELVAIWTHIPAASMRKETLIEAIDEGWLWGAPVSKQHFRIMAFVHTNSLKQTKPLTLLSRLLHGTNLFGAARLDQNNAPIYSRGVDPYVSATPWKENIIKLGESAFTLDPLSSTGVEKAMRFSLQAVISINTMLKANQSSIAQEFYEERLIETVTTHTNWTREFYSQGWPVSVSEFWKLRSSEYTPTLDAPTSFSSRFMGRIKEARQAHIPATEIRIGINDFLSTSWHKKVSLAPEIGFVSIPCVTGDILELKQAIQAPTISRQFVYVDEVEIVPIIVLATTPITIGELFINATAMGFKKVGKILTYLFCQRILVESTQAQ